MKKRYELTLSAADGMCCIYDISCEPKELVKAVRCHFIRIFSIQPETNEFHVQVEFGTRKTFQHDADVIVELEKAPCVKRVIPMNTKGLPEVFSLRSSRQDIFASARTLQKRPMVPRNLRELLTRMLRWKIPVHQQASQDRFLSGCSLLL